MSKRTNIFVTVRSFCISALPPRSQNLETFIKTACIHKHIAALNNTIHHAEQNVHCTFPNMTIMQLIILFNGDYNHFFPLLHTVTSVGSEEAKQNSKQSGELIQAMISSHLILTEWDYF